jgi:hypothetical protein
LTLQGARAAIQAAGDEFLVRFAGWQQIDEQAPGLTHQQQWSIELARNDKKPRKRDKPRIEPIGTVVNELEAIK